MIATLIQTVMLASIPPGHRMSHILTAITISGIIISLATAFFAGIFLYLVEEARYPKPQITQNDIIQRSDVNLLVYYNRRLSKLKFVYCILAMLSTLLCILEPSMLY